MRSLTAALSTLVIAVSLASCTYDYEGARRCSNGVRDGDEAAVDCGGSCAACGATGGAGGSAGSSQIALERVWEKIEQDPDKPPARHSAVLVYQAGDPGSVLLFSGDHLSSTTDRNDTWVLEDKTWTELQPSTRPPARSNAMAGYDPLAKRTVLAGGYVNSVPAKDSWMWNGTDWSQLGSTTIALDSGGMVWDASANKLLMFAANSGMQVHALSGNSWDKITTLDPPSSVNIDASAYVYDIARKLTVMFDKATGETWEYVHATPFQWTLNAEAGGPGGRCGVAMAYEERREVTVLFGGASSPNCQPPGDPFDDTWEYDGKSWSKVATTGTPTPRFRGRMVYDAGHDRMVLVGGADAGTKPIAAQTWVYYTLGGPCTNTSDCTHGNCVNDVCSRP